MLDECRIHIRLPMFSLKIMIIIVANILHFSHFTFPEKLVNCSRAAHKLYRSSTSQTSKACLKKNRAMSFTSTLIFPNERAMSSNEQLATHHYFLYIAQCSKIEKKCNFKSTKTHYLHFQKWQKINFCTRNKFKIAFLVVLNFFPVQ